MGSGDISYEQEREVERLLAAANLQRMRDQWTEAEDSCRKALVIAPGDPIIHEMLGDILWGRGKLDAALSEYRAVMEISPGKLSIETKYAKVVLEIGERERERAIAEDMLENPQAYAAGEKKPATALLLAIIPGLGQFYNGEIIKALVIWGVFFLFFLSLALPHNYPRGINDIGEFLYFTNPVVLVLGLLALMAYIYGVIDAPISAGKSIQGPKSLAEP